MRPEPYRFDMNEYIARHRDPDMQHLAHRESDEVARLSARVDELLKHNTLLMEEARDARRDTAKMQRALSQIVERIGLAEVANVKATDGNARDSLFGETPSKAMLDVFAERRSQRVKHGYSFEHDDKHRDVELLRSAISRLLRLMGSWNLALRPKVLAVAEAISPWMETPSSPRKMLVVATSLLVAEIERRDRAAEQGASTTPGPSVGVTNTPRVGRCNNLLRQMNPPVPVPRTCAECGLGPCKFSHGGI